MPGLSPLKVPCSILPNSPAHCAAAKGHIEGLILLQEKKGNLWLQNAKGEYPIHEAALAKENGEQHLSIFSIRIGQ